MDIQTAILTVLERNPNGMRAKDLVDEVTKLADVSRSTAYTHLSSLKIRGLIYDERGKYWRRKPKGTKDKDQAMMAAMAHFRRRANEDGVTPYKYLADEYDRS